MQPRQTVLTAAGSIGQASGDLLRHMGEGEIDEKFQVWCYTLSVSMAPLSKQEDTLQFSVFLKKKAHVIISWFIIKLL